MRASYLREFIERKRCTLLAVGPVSLNCIDAVVEIANENDFPIQLIASRRQIDSDAHGGGYVNNWKTHEFASYVKDRNPKGNVVISRDHGGPWQSPQETNGPLAYEAAMESAKASFETDILAGFDALHIDPSIDLFQSPDVDAVLDRVFELYEFCWSVAQSSNREVLFEIGTEEQSGGGFDAEELEYVLSRVYEYVTKQKLPKPAFIVVQTGTKIAEMRNVGTFDSPLRIANELPAEIQIPQVLRICSKYEIMIKEHNADYLSDMALTWHPKLGIHAANVAPEFGVCESKAFCRIMEESGLEACKDRFLELAYGSDMWKKWMLADTTASDEDRALIAGHYVFSSNEFAQLKSEASEELAQKGRNLDDELRQAVKASVLRYVKHFNLL